MNLAGFHSFAATAAERLMFSMAVGSLLALVVWLLLRALRIRDSRTSFAVWFATLLITAVLPLLGLRQGQEAAGVTESSAVVTVSSNWALGIFSVWALVALIGLARVTLALWQVHRLRSGALGVAPERIGGGLAALVDDCKRSRPVEILVSSKIEVPTAIGFFRPAVVLPEWLLEGTPEEELKYIILHELEHLRRHDDWTNLAQQLVRALLFFVPSVWWIERRLSLDREMACDDGVLAHCGTPEGYAECLVHVAEKSFLRRQLAMAQAAVARLRQLTQRVTKILDPNRPQPRQMWKPAVPAVMVAAGLCVFTASQGPALVDFADIAPTAAVATPAGGITQAKSSVIENAETSLTPAMASVVPAHYVDGAAGGASAPKVKAWNAALRSSEKRRKAPAKLAAQALQNDSMKVLSSESKPVQAELAQMQTAEAAKIQPGEPAVNYVTVREEFFMVVRQGPQSAEQQSLQVHYVEISVVPVKPPQKQVPRKI